MKNKFCRSNFLILFLALLPAIIRPSLAISSENLKLQTKKKIRRISAQMVDLGKVQTIYMVPGMATLIEIPSQVTGVRLGNPDVLKYFRPENPDSEVTLILKEGSVRPTNFFIISGKKKYIFDIVPSNNIHQDSVQIVGGYGGAGFDESKSELIDSSDSETKGVSK